MTAIQSPVRRSDTSQCVDLTKKTLPFHRTAQRYMPHDDPFPRGRSHRVWSLRSRETPDGCLDNLSDYTNNDPDETDGDGSG